MSEQIPLIDVIPYPVPEPPPEQTDIYLVAAYRKEWRAWKIHRETSDDEHRTREEAERHAARLSSHWLHPCIIHVRLGGDR